MEFILFVTIIIIIHQLSLNQFHVHIVIVKCKHLQIKDLLSHNFHGTLKIIYSINLILDKSILK